uniref:YicC/YloC family endoribonuclease n=1 Tax=Dialister succinatiphilus TaxID=487173 RepID=UPI0040287EB0
MNSMTGYGRGSAENGRGIVTAELKSVNSRFLEINMRSDHFSAFLEDRASRKIKEALHRGKVTVYLSFQPSAEGRNLKVVLDRNLLEAYAAALTEGRRMKGLQTRNPAITDLLTLTETC